MKQEQSVQAYLNRIDRLLRPLPASLVLGALFLGAAYGLWRALRGYVRAVSRGKSALDAVKAG